MKTKLTLLFSLSYFFALAQIAQITWDESGKQLMRQSVKIVNQKMDENEINRQMILMDKNSFQLGKPDKNGDIKCLRLNVYYDPERFAQNKRLDPIQGDFVVTVDVVFGNTPVEILHPKTKKRLVSASYVVPQNLTPKYEFYRPTLAQRKKMTLAEIEFIRSGGLALRAITTKTRKETLIRQENEK